MVLVPRRVDTIATERRQRIVFLIESEGVDRVALTLLLSLVFCPMALEAEVIFLVLIWLRKVVPVDATPSLNRTNDEAFAVAEAADASCRKLEGGLH